MKKVYYIFSVLLLSTLACSAQRLIITEVDAPETGFFNAASMETLGKNMDLNLSGNSLSVKIGDEPELILTQLSNQFFETERKTKDGIIKITLKLKITNSAITKAEFTGTIIPEDKSKKTSWWTVTARNNDVISSI